MALEDLYREIITSHHKHPRHWGELPGAPHARRDNPSCGDAVDVWARVEGGRLADLTFTGKGCAVSQASASLMTVALRGKTLSEARDLAGRFRAMVLGEAPPAPALGDLVALGGVSKLHARRKCALLAWQALDDALDDACNGASAAQANPAD